MLTLLYIFGGIGIVAGVLGIVAITTSIRRGDPQRLGEWRRRYYKTDLDMDWIIDVVQEAIGDMGCSNPKREHFSQAMFEVIKAFERRWPEVALTPDELENGPSYGN